MRFKLFSVAVVFLFIAASVGPAQPAAAQVETGSYDENFSTTAYRLSTTHSVWDPWEGEMRLRKSDGSMGRGASLATSADGSSFVGWIENRAGIYHAFLQRLDPQGSRQWQHDVDMGQVDFNAPVDLNLDKYGNLLALVGANVLRYDAQGGLLATYGLMNLPGSTGKTVYDPVRDELWVSWFEATILNLVKITSAGSQVWPSPKTFGLRQGCASFNGSDGDIALNPAGGIYVTWNCLEGSNWNVYLQRFSVDGAPQWAADRLAPSTGNFPKLAAEPDGDVFLLWANSSGAYIQKYNPSGTQLLANLVLFRPFEGLLAVSALVSPSGRLVVGFESYYNGDSYYLAEFDGLGKAIWSQPVKVGDRFSGDFGAEVQADGANNAYMAWYILDYSGGGVNIRVQAADPQGTLLWGGSSIVNEDLGTSSQVDVNGVMGADGAFYLAWRDERRGDTDIYTQKLTPDGATHWSAGYPVTALSWGNIYSIFSMLADAAGNTHLFWQGTRSDGQYGTFYQSVDPNGNFASLNDNMHGAYWSNTYAPDPQGGFALIYVADNSQWLQRLDAEFKPRWPTPTSLAFLNTINCAGSEFGMAARPDGYVGITWNCDKALYVDLVAPNGALAWPAPVQANPQTTPLWVWTPRMTWDAAGNMVVVWTEGGISMGQKITPAGQLLWGSGKPVGQSYSNGINQLFTKASGSLVFGTIQSVEQISPDGASEWSYQFPATGNLESVIALAPNDNVGAAWVDTRDGNQDIYATILDSDGQPLFPEAVNLVQPDYFYLPAGSAISRAVDTLPGKITQAILTSDFDANNGSALFYLSNNGGKNWFLAEPGVVLKFTSAGSDLRWRVDLTADPSRPRGPSIRSVHIEYTANPPGYDDYEMDDTCADAQPIAADGAPQLHNFHAAADQDWVWFDARGGQEYILATRDASASVDTRLTLYDSCGGAALADANDPLSPAAQFTWTAPADGRYYLQVNPEGAAEPPNQYSLVVRAFDQTPVAVIVAGQAAVPEAQAAVDASANLAYMVLRSAEVPKEHILYFSTQPEQDVDGDGENDAAGPPLAASVRDAVQDWAREQGVGLGTPFYLFLAGDGGEDAFQAGVLDAEILSADLDLWLTNLERTSGADAVNVILEAPNSGSFINSTATGPGTISGRNRVIVTSTSDVQDSYIANGETLFSSAFWNAVGQKTDLKLSYEEALQSVIASGLAQTPWIDSNGDQLPDGSGSTLQAANQLAAVTATSPVGWLAQDRGLRADRGAAPILDQLDLSPLDQGNLTITVRARDDQSVASVKVLVYPYSPKSTTGVFTPAVFELLPVAGQPDMYSGEITGLSMHKLVMYAWDAEGNRSDMLSARIARVLFLPAVRK